MTVFAAPLTQCMPALTWYGPMSTFVAKAVSRAVLHALVSRTHQGAGSGRLSPDMLKPSICTDGAVVNVF